MTGYYLRIFLSSLILTLVVELAAGLVFRYSGKDCGTIALVNMITNPLYVLAVLILRVFLAPFLLRAVQAVMECGIILLEGFLYHRNLEKQTHPYLFSLTANLLSILAGILVSGHF